MAEPLDEAAHRYEQAESGFLAAVRRDAPRAELADLASAVAQVAETWNAVAHAAFHEAADPQRTNLDWLTERTEVLSELWADIGDAYRA